MAQGLLLWFDQERGFGFLRPDKGPRDVFLHASSIEGGDPDRLESGMRFEFELVQMGDGRLIARRAVPEGRAARGRPGRPR